MKLFLFIISLAALTSFVLDDDYAQFRFTALERVKIKKKNDVVLSRDYGTFQIKLTTEANKHYLEAFSILYVDGSTEKDTVTVHPLKVEKVSILDEGQSIVYNVSGSKIIESVMFSASLDNKDTEETEWRISLWTTNKYNYYYGFYPVVNE